MAETVGKTLTELEILSKYPRKRNLSLNSKPYYDEYIVIKAMNEFSTQNVNKVISDYEEVNTDKKRLVKEMDVTLNGQEGSAEQASLCDIVIQLKDFKHKYNEMNKELDIVHQCLTELYNTDSNIPVIKEYLEKIKLSKSV